MTDQELALARDTVAALLLQADAYSVREIALGMRLSQARVRALLSGPEDEGTQK